MSPYQHGEVFVTEDGAETDLDLGHYERFIDEDLNKYLQPHDRQGLLERPQQGTPRRVPRRDRSGHSAHHRTKSRTSSTAVGKKTNADVVITEIGGTAGDIESQPFLEAIRQVSLEVGKENCLFIHVTLVPYLKSSGEHKSKPTQHSVKEMQGMGISPDIIVLRCDEPIDPSIFHKIALFCNVKPDCVIENMTIPVLYEAPIMLEKNNFSSVVCRELNLEDARAGYDRVEPHGREDPQPQKDRAPSALSANMSSCMTHTFPSSKHSTMPAMSTARRSKSIGSIPSSSRRKTLPRCLSGCDGILVPGGFGNRGIEGMIYAAQYARESNVPYLGICLGMQIAVIEYARHVLRHRGCKLRRIRRVRPQ